MKKTDHIGIVIGRKPFGCYKVISDFAYCNDRVVQVVFDGQDFIWIPTWREVGAIVESLYLAENLNRTRRGKKVLSFYEHLVKMKMDYIGEIKPC